MLIDGQPHSDIQTKERQDRKRRERRVLGAMPPNCTAPGDDEELRRSGRQLCRAPDELVVSAHHDVAEPVELGRVGGEAANRARDRAPRTARARRA